MDEDLKPCPLCGGEPVMGCYEDALAQNGTWEIECQKCELLLQTHYLLPDYMRLKRSEGKTSNYKLAIKRWNRRKSG